jgi:energy-converting hydrogenase B subunit D
MVILQALILLLVGVAGTSVVLTRKPLAQLIMMSFYGLLLGLMFFAFMAPDVAFSQIVVGTVAMPLLVLLAITKVRRNE